MTDIKRRSFLGMLGLAPTLKLVKFDPAKIEFKSKPKVDPKPKVTDAERISSHSYKIIIDGQDFSRSCYEMEIARNVEPILYMAGPINYSLTLGLFFNKSTFELAELSDSEREIEIHHGKHLVTKFKAITVYSSHGIAVGDIAKMQVEFRSIGNVETFEVLQ